MPPHFLILDPGSHATVSAGTPAASAASSQTVPTSWWQTLDAAVANAVEGAAAVAFISPQRWVKLLHILSGVKELRLLLLSLCANGLSLVLTSAVAAFERHQ